MADSITRMADDAAEQTEGYTKEEWDQEPDSYLGYCWKNCYQNSVLTKGNIFEFGIRGVYICSCGYAYPPFGHPDAIDLTDMKDNNAPEVEGESDKSKPHVSYNSGENEWYTPEKFIEAARSTMGKIDLDPASSEIANTIVEAIVFYDINTDGLFQKWQGKVWLNPPYKTGLIEKFTGKLSKEFETGNVEEFIALVNNATETKWFNNLVKSCSVVCFVTSRIQYWSPNRESHTPLQGQAILYGGGNPQKFVDNFKKFGFIARMIH